MNERQIIRGAVLGAAGGMAMAMWSMIALAVNGDGFFTPVNVIAHTLWSGAPLDGAFDGPAFALGLGVHMMISMMIGVVIVGLVTRLSLGTSAARAVALAVPLAGWAGQIILWEAIDPAARAAFTPWVLFVGHVMFGMVAAIGLGVANRQTITGSVASHQPA